MKQHAANCEQRVQHAEAKVQEHPGFKACFGGEELKRATSALAGGIDMPPLDGNKGISAASGATAQSSRPSSGGDASISAILEKTSHPGATESDLVLRELALAANQYQRSEALAGPSGQDHETLYNHGLVLQEMAAKLNSCPADQLKLLQQACELYASAAAARPSSHNVLYNWGVALSDLARLLRDTQPAESLSFLQQASPPVHPSSAAVAGLRQASHKYAGSLDLQPGNPQALNNWGLVLQEMSGLAQSASERDQLVSYALEKFRHAIRLRHDFDRGCYNLGTVLYTYACAVQAELAAELKGRTQQEGAVWCLEQVLSGRWSFGCFHWSEGNPVRDVDSPHQGFTYRCCPHAGFKTSAVPRPATASGRLTSPDAATSRERHQRETRTRGLFTAAAQYICLAAALQPGRDIYRRSLAVVKPLLPLPFLRAGYLMAPLAHTLGSAGEMWRRVWFVLDHTSLRSASDLESSLSNTATGSLPSSQPTLRVGHAVGEVPLVVPLGDVLAVRRVNDPSLPEGEALWLQLSRPLGSSISKGVGSLQPQLQSPPQGSFRDWEAGPVADGDGGSSSSSAMEAPCAQPRLCVWLVADDVDSADAWTDALLLAQHVVKSRSPGALAEALMPVAAGGGRGPSGGGAGGSGEGGLWMY
ncbi:hypothetical protein VOLCADRAFT_121444 [Volvox carteri f. nagariensis]|uniref:PH domain-containing protein n=1 Tax=Volvox carteri f. nagariensis TaxID=3068 RepID=D8UAJ1_VOLCA|nr:uncharacterized protein VOLCADRAFT_121444 [Volvox carteri f. nagariensis]EFJ43333.1 hypothetical protein VOLCADRAFT_121444 [Volvox carteri f. nagariensis]|eukprot:XP_002955693.1 hypothetical protein VOLCADRAFT_121444 [Volvox carteri f. nagariensis]